MDKKTKRMAFFMRDARTINELKDYRKKCIRKCINAKPYTIEKIIELSNIDYENFCNDMLVGRQVIADNIDLMFVDDNNVWHCLLVVEEGNLKTGVLVESKNKEYAMYSATYQENTGLKLI